MPYNQSKVIKSIKDKVKKQNPDYWKNLDFVSKRAYIQSELEKYEEATDYTETVLGKTIELRREYHLFFTALWISILGNLIANIAQKYLPLVVGKTSDLVIVIIFCLGVVYIYKKYKKEHSEFIDEYFNSTQEDIDLIDEELNQ